KNALYLVADDLPAESSARRYVDIARGETERISKIVRQILGFYRPPAARAPIDLNAIVTEVIDLLRPQLRKARVEPRLDLDPALPQIIASADQMRQVLLNLAINSVQAMPGGGALSIATRPLSRGKRSTAVAGPGEHLVVEIADDGPGIPADVRARLFEPFVTTKERGGTGLGLWVCREIVQAHGGTIRLDAVAPHGSRFTLVLPLRPKEVS
ncbi:MAG TPA: ATP-binding protein, partial [Candidatus Dormibacteraeota bacterium]|nr:ATP-binding protein [Candidatus Dormibacteraeota bacterium]